MTEREAIKCGRCGGKMNFEKEWDLKGKHDNVMKMRLYKCEKCGASLRVAVKGEAKQ